jgi:hypothetical protein
VLEWWKPFSKSQYHVENEVHKANPATAVSNVMITQLDELIWSYRRILSKLA